METAVWRDEMAPSTKEMLDRALIQAMSLAEEVHSHLSRYGAGGTPEHLAGVPEQPGQRDGGTLRKVARSHVPGTECYVDVAGGADGWAVKVMDRDGTVLYGCGPGSFDLDAASAVIPHLKPE